ncbi:hypothetical protein ATE84_1408 [Aquimarina sp. MAR_2010_214]|uniref:DUF3592 domain-containing protein n=1 Tax=Aquimarina sp. MAR_2010_214 TaxID=1250026 RepID=UPI000C7024C4|nr:DUF3592 domain-containing protein [Aquimarina sp. MAR_2010_214]PKV49386.1 hypothetical protein ATE84_1408 [Aquimarina sp. MAR_2010_214]
MNKKLIRLIAVLLLCISVLAYNTYAKKETLEKNGVSTSAVIEKISTNKYDNELSPVVENIHIRYKYMIDAEEYIKTQEISRHEHDLYFTKTGKVGDSIKIIYDSEKPTNSRIEKVK